MDIKKDINSILKVWAEDVKDEIGKKIVDTRTVDSGDLLRSVKYTIVEDKVRFTMLRYGQYTDEGKPIGQNWITDPKKQKAPRNFFRKVILNNEDDLATLLDEQLGDRVEDEIANVFDVRGRNFKSSSKTQKRTGRTTRIRR
jgi:hypothetical protein